MKVISIVNQKGGVGKTTLTRNLASLLTRRGYRVLALDLDAQANLTLYSGLNPVDVQQQTEGMKSVLLRERSLSDVIVKTSDGFDLAPSCLSFAAVELRIQGAADPNFVLKSALDTIQDRYDIALLDNAPALGRVVINSLVASDSVIIPAKTDLFSLSGLAFVLETIQSVQSSGRARLSILGVVPNFFHPRMLADRDSLDQLNRYSTKLRLRVFTPLREQTSVVRSTFETQAAVGSAHKSQFADGLEEIADAIIDTLLPSEQIRSLA